METFSVSSSWSKVFGFGKRSEFLLIKLNCSLKSLMRPPGERSLLRSSREGEQLSFSSEFPPSARDNQPEPRRWDENTSRSHKRDVGGCFAQKSVIVRGDNK